MDVLDQVGPFFDRVKDLFGGGLLTPIMIAAGLLVLYLAIKAVGSFLKIMMLLGAAGLFVGVAPWSGDSPVDTPVASCAAAQATDDLDGLLAVATKRVTVKSVGDDARCNRRKTRLARGSAEVQLRTFYDLPFRTVQISGGGEE